MSRALRSFLIRCAVTALIGAGVVWLVLELHGYADLVTDIDRYRLLCDAFTIPGTIILMVGLLVAISGTGAFDGLSYVLNWLRLTLLPIGKQERYYDHVERRHAKKAPNGLFLIVTGGLFLVVALVFMSLFHMAGG